MEENALNEFGELFIESVRDSAIARFRKLMTGKLKGTGNPELHMEIVEKIPAEGRKTMEKVVYNVIDDMLFKMLFMFEENSDEWQIANADAEIESLADESDGLSGELYTDEGWIAQYSSYDSTEK